MGGTKSTGEGLWGAGLPKQGAFKMTSQTPVNMENDIQLMKNDIKLFERWLSETPPEVASRALHEFFALNGDLDVIDSELSALEPVRDKAIALPLVNQWITIANLLLENPLVKSQPKGEKNSLSRLKNLRRTGH